MLAVVFCCLQSIRRTSFKGVLQNASETGELDGPGRFACFGAWLSKSGACDLLSAEGIMRAQAYKRIPSFLQIFVARPLRVSSRSLANPKHLLCGTGPTPPLFIGLESFADAIAVAFATPT